LGGSSRSFKVIDVDKSKKPVTSACYDVQQFSLKMLAQPEITKKSLKQLIWGHRIWPAARGSRRRRTDTAAPEQLSDLGRRLTGRQSGL